MLLLEGTHSGAQNLHPTCGTHRLIRHTTKGVLLYLQLENRVLEVYTKNDTGHILYDTIFYLRGMIFKKDT